MTRIDFPRKERKLVEIREKRAKKTARNGEKPDGMGNSIDVLVGNDIKQRKSRQHVIELYDGLRPSLRAYLSSRGLTKEHAEDVIQEVFLRLLRHLVARGPDENQRGWLFRVAHNLSMDFHRSERQRSGDGDGPPMRRERADPSPDPEQKVILGERRRRFREAFAQLTPKQRNCLLLRAQGLRYREIAVVMGVSVQRVGELMHRAVRLVEVGGQSKGSVIK